MNYFTWIFAALLAVILSLYIIFYEKNTKIIFLFLIIPFASTFFIAFLQERYPDSVRIIQVQAIAALFAEITMLFQLKKEGNTKFFAVLSYLIILLVWNYLYFPILFLIHIPSWFSVLFTIIEVILFAVSIFFAKHKSFPAIIFSAVVFFTVSSFFYTALTDLCFNHRLYSVFLTIGSLLSLLQLIAYTYEFKLVNKKYSQLIFEISFITAFSLISIAGVLMIF